MRFTQRWAFQKDDTALLLALTSGFALLAAVVWGVWGTAGVPALLVLLFGGLVALLLNLYRLRQQEALQHLHHVQALHSLYALLPPLRAPLPPLTQWAASPELAGTLVATIRQQKPAFVLELGSGASTLAMAYALEQVGTGRVLAVDHDRNYARRTTALLATHELHTQAEVLHAPLKETALHGETMPWYDPNAVEDVLSEGRSDAPISIDLLVVDGPPHETCAQARYPAVPLLHEHLSETFTIVVDDAFRPDEQEILARWQDAFDFEIEMRASHEGIALLRRAAIDDST